MATQLQKEARTHNWNKACLLSAHATMCRTITWDKRLTDRNKRKLKKACVIVNDVLKKW
jgi:hypothetical protein